jgi:hypothetical protein
VPEDIELSGNEETFTITATYETGKLYGTVIGQRDFVITRR